MERDYAELKPELGLGHFEGRGWRGFHHHAILCIAAYGFLVAERSRFSPSARAGRLVLRAPGVPPDFQPRGSARARRAASCQLDRYTPNQEGQSNSLAASLLPLLWRPSFIT